MKGKGFTLIELLIVIAIILILIAIALPNFLEAQIRARVTAAMGDIRTLATTFEMYYQDFNQYPPTHDPNDPGQNGLYQITSPIKYISSIPQDPFAHQDGLIPEGGEFGWEVASSGATMHQSAFLRCKKAGVNVQTYHIASHGPNQQDNFDCNDVWPWCKPPSANPCVPTHHAGGEGFMTYSATNGTKSGGELYQMGGTWRSGGYCIDGWNHIVGKYPPFN